MVSFGCDLAIALTMWWLFGASVARAAEFNASAFFEVSPYSPMTSLDTLSFKENEYTGLFDRQKLDVPVTINSSFVGTAFELSGTVSLPIWSPDINKELVSTRSQGYSNATGAGDSEVIDDGGAQSAPGEGVIVQMSNLPLGLYNFTTTISETVSCTFRALRFQVPFLTQA